MLPQAAMGLAGSLLLAGNGLLGALAGTGILLSVLTADRQATTVTNTAIAADLHQTLDIQAHLTAEVTLNLQVVLDVVTELADLILGEILDAGVGIDADIREHFLRGGQADTVDVGQADLHALFSGQVYARNTCHVYETPP